MIQSFNSRLLDSAVNEISKLPGIGRKTALRLALHLLKEPEETAMNLGTSIIRLRQEVCYCALCHNISESEICPICSDPRRDKESLCIVENVKDVLSIEATREHHGLYHVLGGLISPADGIGPDELELESLINRVSAGDIKEIILALSPTMEGDTTSFYIYRRLQNSGIEISTLARGLSVGDELEYTDELTLGKSIQNRIPYNQTFKE